MIKNSDYVINKSKHYKCGIKITLITLILVNTTSLTQMRNKHNVNNTNISNSECNVDDLHRVHLAKSRVYRYDIVREHKPHISCRLMTPGESNSLKLEPIESSHYNHVTELTPAHFLLCL